MRNVLLIAFLFLSGGCGEPSNIGGPGTITIKIPREMRNRGFLGVSFDGDELADAVVKFATPGGAADNSGIQKGDAVISLDGVGIGSTAEFLSISRTWKPDDVVTVILDRDGEVLSKTIELMDIDEFLQLQAWNRDTSNDERKENANE